MTTSTQRRKNPRSGNISIYYDNRSLDESMKFDGINSNSKTYVRANSSTGTFFVGQIEIFMVLIDRRKKYICMNSRPKTKQDEKRER